MGRFARAVVIVVSMLPGVASAAQPTTAQGPTKTVKLSRGDAFLRAWLLGPEERTPALTLGGARLRVPTVTLPEAAAGKPTGPRRSQVSPFSSRRDLTNLGAPSPSLLPQHDPLPPASARQLKLTPP